MGSVILLVLSMLAPTSPAMAAQGVSDTHRPTHVPGEVLIRFAKGNAELELTQVLAAMGHPAGPTNRNGRQRIRLNPATSVVEAIAYLQGLNGIDIVQPNYLYYPAVMPNDPEIGELWAARNTGQTVTDANYSSNNPGQPGADMGLEQAWAVQTDCRGVVVAVIDSGVDYSHADLAGSIWDGMPQFPNHGWDFAAGDNDPLPDLLVSEDNHGTHVAGIIGAVGNNATGMSGVCWNAEIMAIRAGGFLGGLSTADVIDSIEFAVDNGASILNLSFGGELAFDTLFSNAIDYARTAGVLVVAAAGNGGLDGIGDDIDGAGDDGLQATTYYPCAFPQDNLICVAASDQAHVRSSFTNFGASHVDTAAPGTNILSTTYANARDVMTGTSMAAPQVTGVAALTWAQNPAYSYLDVRAALLTSGTPVPGWDGLTVSGQVVNGDGAVRHIHAPVGLSFTLE